MRGRRPHLILLGIILVTLGVVVLLGVPGSPIHKKVTLGLDLQGGVEVILKAVPPKGQQVTPDGLQKSVEIMRSRVDKLGVSEPDVRKQDPDQIVIQLAGVHCLTCATQIIGSTAQLELYDLETSLLSPSIGAQGTAIPTTNLYALLSALKSKAKSGTPDTYYLFKGKRTYLYSGPYQTRQDAVAAEQRQSPDSKTKFPKGPFTVLAVPQHTVVITCSATDVVCPGPAQGGVASPPPKGSTFYYVFKHDLTKGVPQMTGKDINGGGTQSDFDTNGQPQVNLAFTHHGGTIFQKITRDEWLRGKIRNSPQHFAIVLDGDIKSFPQIDYTDSSLADGISGGSGRITGIGSIKESKDIALVLQTGALPYTFKTLARTDVSATLGKDSLNQAKLAALIGLAVVAVFLLLLYRFLGVVAVLGLGIYAAFLYGAILLFKVTMTLPGFAGLILTIGVAADANVVIFERIKEEVRAGKSVRAAIAAGYSKGFRTIIDANVVTAITAMILFAVATAQVKGFALMLLIGTAISMITAVAGTRAMLGLLAGFRWFDNPRFMGAHGQQSAKWLQIDFMKRRYLWFAISGAIIVIGVASLGAKGLNLGIDFKGGTQVTFKTPAFVSLSKIRNEADQIGQKDAVIQGRGTAHGDSYQNFQIRTKSLTAAEQNKLSSDLTDRYHAQSLGIQNVSSSFGSQIARLAIIAVLVSLVLIVIYIAVRFDFKFALPVIIALLHDLLITFGVYSLTGREVTTSTVAAVLTVLGYSIYDTIIIFDRIRENVPLMRRAPFAEIANISLWETIRRSLATTFITLLPVASLLAFGGATLKDFAFALMVGITSGAYSSIFIAAPLLTMWKEREPEYRRRIGHETKGDGTAALLAAEAAAAAQPEPALLPEALPGEPASSRSQAKRERRRQRRSTRPHGRAR